MSGMRHLSEMEPKALIAITPGCCGPENGLWDPERRYWICDYHDGYNDGLNDCRDPS